MPCIKTLSSLNTELCADAVEWCPVDGFHDLLVCANYELAPQSQSSENHDEVQPSEQNRTGYLYLYKLQNDLTLTEVQRTATPGILDCKWSRYKILDSVCLAAVDSIGVLRIFKLDSDESHLVEVNHIQLTQHSGTLALSLDLSNFLLQSADEISIVVSDSAGYVQLVSLSGTNLAVTATIKAHDFEAWIVAFDYHNPSIIFSGGDDAILKMFDLRMESLSATHRSREHKAGVTSIQCNWSKEYFLASGSYDERILFWDRRQMKSPFSEVVAPGGVWRIKHNPTCPELIASPCMYGGSIVIDTIGKPAIVTNYSFHTNINYGMDWCWKKVKRNDETVTVLSVCSFYDKLLSLAEYSSDEKNAD